MSLLQQIHDAMDITESDLAIPPVTDKEELLGRIAESVTAEDARTLQAYILEQRLPHPDQFWELTMLMAPCLTTENLTDKPQFFTTVRRCLVHFSRHGKPKEMVLAFLEQLEGFHDDARFICILPCLQNALLQLPVKRGRSLELALDTLSCHITAIPALQNLNLEGEEIKLLETDETVSRFLNVVPAFLDFIRPFLEGVSSDGDGSGRQWELKVMKKHLLQLLQHPLSFLDLRFNPKERSPKTYSRETAETVVQCLTMIEKNFYRLLIQNPADGNSTFSDVVQKAKESSPSSADVEDIDMDEENRENERRALGVGEGKTEDNQEVMLSRMSAACLLYLVEVEGQGQQCWPAVLSAQHLLHASLPYVHLLLTTPTQTIVYKGLALLSFHLACITHFSLDADFLDDSNVMPVINALITVMRSCPIRELRVSALSVFRAFFPCLTCSGRYQLMKSILASCEHAGVKAVVVGMLKNEIDMALSKLQHAHAGVVNNTITAKLELLGDSTKSKDSTTVARKEAEVLSEYFFHNRLKQLLVLVTRLSDGAATDLLEESDMIMATLNLLRYLVLRDSRHSNQTGIWGMWGWLEEDYLSKVRVGLDMSVGHYQLELKSLTNKRPGGGGAQQQQEIEAAVSVAGMTLPPMTHEQRLNVMNSALTTFDMIKCVLARLCELIDLKGKE
ncbi:glomulin-like [Babylonia areolata]|uniref:glomulin-like n=1 Tax=Babylonia areolata TaxID=304850 RepID=UPI003FD4408F